MVEVSLGLAGSAFAAGLLMFLAPCTLPLVPAFLAFITGVKPGEVSGESSTTHAVRQIRVNSLAFVLGFSFVFISFGMLAGFIGLFVGQFKVLLSQIGGALIIVLALTMLNVIRLEPLMKERRVKFPQALTLGNPLSSGLIGVTFALGWTPCVGPVLASVLLLASTSTTVLSGGILLAIFSLGLAIPFLLVAFIFGQAQDTIYRYSWVSRGVNVVGGVFLLFIGLLLLSNNFGLTVEYGNKLFELFGADILFDYL